MAKKKGSSGGQAPPMVQADSYLTPALSTTLPSPDRGGGEEEALPYVMGQWHGMPQWKCRMCAFDTLDGEEAILAHIVARHVTVEAPKPRLIPVYDRWGNLVSK